MRTSIQLHRCAAITLDGYSCRLPSVLRWPGVTPLCRNHLAFLYRHGWVSTDPDRTVSEHADATP